MKKDYSDCNIVSIRFEQEQIKAINELSVHLGLPRNTVIRRLFCMILKDAKNGRKIFEEG